MKVWERNHQGTLKDKALAIRRYLEHIEEVKAAVPPARPLIFTVTDGWEPLCRFVGVPVPDEPFPRVNERAETRKTVRRFAALGYGVLVVLVTLIVGLGAAVLSVLP